MIVKLNNIKNMYTKFIETLDSYFQGRWFLDSGSLLGVIRDGKFLASDAGIDISVIIEDHHNPKIEECVKNLSKQGFVITRFQFMGRTYKYCLAPKKGNKIQYAIDLHLFKKFGENYLCPNVRQRNHSRFKVINLMRDLKSAHIIKKMEPGIIGFFERIFIYLYRDVFEYFGKPANRYKNLTDNNTYKWVIPANMIRGVEPDHVYGFNVLKDCDDYLSYRYGNWRIPVSDWVTMRDDGGFKKSTIQEVQQMLS